MAVGKLPSYFELAFLCQNPPLMLQIQMTSEERRFWQYRRVAKANEAIKAHCALGEFARPRSQIGWDAHLSGWTGSQAHL
jgi:hypothetical protein